MSRGLVGALCAGLLTMTTGCPRDSGCEACSENATCATDTGTAVCTCNAGFVGDGLTCAVPVVHLEVLERNALAHNPHIPLWVAGQSGDGAYSVLTGTAGEYDLTVADAAGRYGFVVACSGADLSTRVFDVRATVAELPEVKLYCPQAVAPTTVEVQVSFTNGGVGATSASANFGAVGISDSIPGSGETGNVPVGTYDVFAYSRDGGGTRFRGLLLSDESIAVNTSRVFSFDSGFDFASSSVTLSGTTVADTSVLLQSSLVTRAASHTISNTNTNGGTVQQVPTHALFPGALNVVTAGATGTNSRQRIVFDFASTSGNKNLSPPPYVDSAVVNVAEAVPYNRMRAQWTGGPGNPHLLAAVNQGNLQVLLNVSAGWLGTATSVSFPALSTLAGWDNAWAPVSGLPADWIVYVLTVTNGDPLSVMNLALAFTGVQDGTQFQLSARVGNVTP